AYLMVRGGDAAEPQPGSALNEFTAELMSRGTQRRSAAELAARLERLGGAGGATGGADRQMAWVSAPQVNAEAAFALLAESALTPAFDAEELERLRAESLDSYRVYMRNPGSIAGEVAQ